MRGHRTYLEPNNRLVSARETVWLAPVLRGHRSFMSVAARKPVEEWKPIEGYEGLYEVSSSGRVRSLHFAPPKMLKFGKDKTGYPTVMLSKGGSIKKGGSRKPFTVHRLVALAFHGDKRNPLHREVAHLDGSKTNNAASNLKWVSRTENEHHKYLHGTRNHPASRVRRDPAFRRRLSAEQIAEIRGTTGVPCRELGRRYGVSKDTVNRVQLPATIARRG